MIWIAEKNLIFVHNPKCAGTAIHKALMTRFPKAEEQWGRRYEAARDTIIDLAHMSLSEGRAQFGLDADVASFGFVRDPYARFLSAWRHLKHWNRDFAQIAPDELAFDVLDEERVRHDWKFVHFAPQYRFFFEGPRRAVTRLWKTEALPAAWGEVERAFGFEAPLPYENSLGKGQSELSDALVARLNLLYARDFALFDYPLRRTRAPASRGRELYAKFVRLWPERRKLDMSDKSEI